MKIPSNFKEILEPDPEKRCRFATEMKLEEHVEKHLVREVRPRYGRYRQTGEEWWDLLGKYEEWKEFNRQTGKDPINAVRHGTKQESDDAFWLLCDLYVRFAEEELKNACLVRRTDHYHRLARNEKEKPIGQIIELLSLKKHFFIAADIKFSVRKKGLPRYILCTCYRTEPSMGVNDWYALRQQRSRELSFRAEKEDRWYATSELMANHNPEKR